MTIQIAVLAVAVLFCYAIQPLPGGGYRWQLWWRALRSKFGRGA